ncbi:MAG: transposase [Nitrosomonas ureae]
MFTKEHYIQYLISTPVNYTCTHLADHMEGTSHDAINDYLHRGKVTARDLWKLAASLIADRPEAYLIIDDSVQEKPHAHRMDLVKRQYSGNTHRVVKGIGIVNLVHSAGEDYYPIDFRIYAPQVDGLSKNDHFHDLLRIGVISENGKNRTLSVG